MDDSRQRENGKQEQDHYKNLQSQWLIPPQLMEDPHALTMKFMSILADRDIAIQERNLALSEKKAVLAERDMAILQRDQAISERNNAVVQRDNALAALEYGEGSTMTGSSAPIRPPEIKAPRGKKQVRQQQKKQQHKQNSPDVEETPYRPWMPSNDDIPTSSAAPSDSY